MDKEMRDIPQETEGVEHDGESPLREAGKPLSGPQQQQPDLIQQRRDLLLRQKKEVYKCKNDSNLYTFFSMNYDFLFQEAYRQLSFKRLQRQEEQRQQELQKQKQELQKQQQELQKQQEELRRQEGLRKQQELRQQEDFRKQQEELRRQGDFTHVLNSQ